MIVSSWLPGDDALRQRLIDKLKDWFVVISTHSYGCRVIQRLLEYSASEQIRDVRAELLSSAYSLIQDQFGNYVRRFHHRFLTAVRARARECVRGQIALLCSTMLYPVSLLPLTLACMFVDEHAATVDATLLSSCQPYWITCGTILYKRLLTPT